MSLNVKAALKQVRDFAVGEKPSDFVNSYYNDRTVAKGVGRGLHRELIGGLWEEVGLWQFNLLKSHGLKPSHRLLDVGCGSFRGGVKFVHYLNAGNYFGFDISKALIDVGYRREIEANGLASKLPRRNLCVTDSFSCSEFGGEFDFAIAVSVFSHLPLNHWRIALENLAPQMKTGGSFFATFFCCPEDREFGSAIEQRPGGVVSYPTRDPYHCRVSDVVHLAHGLPWSVELIDIDNHARGQRVLAFRKV